MCQPAALCFAAVLAASENLTVLREWVLELPAYGLRALNGVGRLLRVTLDVDSLPIESHRHLPQPVVFDRTTLPHWCELHR